MIQLDAKATRHALPWRPLIEALRTRFREGCVVPLRHHHEFGIPGEQAGTLLLMPAWIEGSYLGVKIATVVPENAKRNLPAVSALYLLSSATTGVPLALLDGGELTARRTAAVSALAADYLARVDAATLLMVGTGRLSLNLIAAHATVRAIRRVLVWGRRLEAARHIAECVRSEGWPAEEVADLPLAVREADIVSCATLTQLPLIQGRDLKPGTHLDLVGGFKPSMREADDEAVRRSRLYVDTKAGAMKEAGDIVQPLQNGVIASADIVGDLFALARGECAGRTTEKEITFFKSVGSALADLAGATLAYETAQAAAAPLPPSSK